MKKVIMSKSQLDEVLKEADDNSSSVEVPTNNDAQRSYNNSIPNITSVATTMGGDCSAVLTPKGGMSQDSITIPNPLGGTTGGAEALKNNATEVNKALASNINVKIPNVQENKNTFSKKSIEEARLKKIRTEGKVMTKGELRESFYNEVCSSPKKSQKSAKKASEENKYMKALLGIDTTKKEKQKRQSDSDENKYMKAMLGINEKQKAEQ